MSTIPSTTQTITEQQANADTMTDAEVRATTQTLLTRSVNAPGDAWLQAVVGALQGSEPVATVARTFLDDYACTAERALDAALRKPKQHSVECTRFLEQQGQRKCRYLVEGCEMNFGEVWQWRRTRERLRDAKVIASDMERGIKYAV